MSFNEDIFWETFNDNTDTINNTTNINKDSEFYDENIIKTNMPIISQTLNENRLTLGLSLKSYSSHIDKIIEYINTNIHNSSILKHENIIYNTPLIIILKRLMYNDSNDELKQCFNLLSGYNYDHIKLYLITIKNFNNLLIPFNSKVYKNLSNNGKQSTLLNSAILEYFYTDMSFYDDELYNRYIKIIESFNKIEYETEAITVFHGTNIKIHNDTPTSFKAYGFLSTTTNINIAKSYGKIIYTIKIPAKFPYIKLDNSNEQILLPIGTEFNIIHTTCIFDQIFFLNVSNYDNTLFNTFLSLLNKKIKLPIKSNLEHINVIRLPPKVKKSTFPLFCYIGINSEKYIGKNISKNNSDDYTIRRILNEYIASEIYKEFGFKTFDYDMITYENKRCLTSKYIENITNLTTANLTPKIAKEYLNGFFVDCVLANWDVCKPGNIGIIDDIIIRTDVGGALAYRARGEFKASFFSREPLEHTSMINDKFIKECIALNINNSIPKLAYTKDVIAKTLSTILIKILN